MRLRYGNQIRQILENHYEWCKQNGRDVSWYKKYKEDNVLLVATKDKGTKK